MIKRSLIAIADQALLSGLNFLLALVLLRTASKEEYGLYAALINLQPLLSPFHAGIFVSAYLAIAAQHEGSERERYERSMSRLELRCTLAGALLLVPLAYFGGSLLSVRFGLAASAALALNVLGLWWREFLRARHFARFDQGAVLRVDALYALGVVVACAGLVALHAASATSVLALTGAAALIACSRQAVRAANSRVQTNARTDLARSWRAGKWEAYGSFFSWAASQTYVYLAALVGGLAGAAEVSAARLVAMPLALIWVAESNILRPRTSELLRKGDIGGLRAIASRAVMRVVVLSLSYAAVIHLAMPLVDAVFFKGKFAQAPGLATLWIVYFGMTGITTVAASLLRSALEFRRIFIRQVCTSMATAALMLASLPLQSLYAPIACLIVVEIVSAAWLWREVAALLTQPPSLVPARS